MAIFLLGLTSTMMISSLVYALRQSQRNTLRQELIRGGEKIIGQVLSAYAGSHDSYLFNNDKIAGIVLPLATDVHSSKTIFDSSGSLIWSSWKAFGYDINQNQVWQAWQPFSKPVSSDGELLTGPLSSNHPATWPRRIISKYVSAFKVIGPVNKVLQVRVLMRDAQGIEIEMLSSGAALN